MFHIHDYEMEFDGDCLMPTLRCNCGDVAPDPATAIERQRRSSLLFIVLTIGAMTLALLMLWLVGLAWLVLA